MISRLWRFVQEPSCQRGTRQIETLIPSFTVPICSNPFLLKFQCFQFPKLCLLLFAYQSQGQLLGSRVQEVGHLFLISSDLRNAKCSWTILNCSWTHHLRSRTLWTHRCHHRVMTWPSSLASFHDWWIKDLPDLWLRIPKCQLQVKWTPSIQPTQGVFHFLYKLL